MSSSPNRISCCFLQNLLIVSENEIRAQNEMICCWKLVGKIQVIFYDSRVAEIRAKEMWLKKLGYVFGIEKAAYFLISFVDAVNIHDLTLRKHIFGIS